MTFEELRKLKRKSGMRNAQISERSGVPLSTVNKIMSGETKNPRKDSIEAIVQVLKSNSPEHMYLSSYSSCSASMLKEPSAVYGSEAGELSEYFDGRRQGEYTLEDYYKVPEGRYMELIDGVFYDMASPQVVHQRILGELYYSAENFIRGNGGKCEAMVSPMDVKFPGDDKTVVEPDFMIICNPDIINEYINGAPDFIAEIVSPSSVTRDYIIKAALYQRKGVREYWIIDPDKETVIAYDFENASPPRIQSFEGSMDVMIYGGALSIDLGRIHQIIERSK